MIEHSPGDDEKRPQQSLVVNYLSATVDCAQEDLETSWIFICRSIQDVLDQVAWMRLEVREYPFILSPVLDDEIGHLRCECLLMEIHRCGKLQYSSYQSILCPSSLKG